MGLQIAIILSLLAVQIFAAPNGCIDSCTSYQRTYQTQTSSGHQDHAGLREVGENLDDTVYAKPGNWTEENHYRTDGGHGNVHEERGQYVNGPKRVRYYKKNYTASYSTGGHGNAAGSSESELNRDRHSSLYSPGSQQLIDSQRGYNQYGNLETTAEQHEYNRIHSVHSSSARRTGQSERLEDFGVYGGNSQVSQQGVTGYETRNVQEDRHVDASHPANWSRVDAYRTDGGHGNVYEEEGQYVTGPKKVRYFKRNYTSSYRTGGVPDSDLPTTGVHEVQRELENLHREFGREIQHLTNTAHRETGSLHSGVVDTTGHSNLQATRDNYNRDQSSQGSVSVSSIHHNEEEHVSSTSNGAIRRLPYTAPSQRIYSTESHNAYERREGYHTQPDYRHVIPTSDYSQVQTDRTSAFDRHSLRRENEQRAYEHSQRADILATQESANTESFIGSDNDRQSIYNQRLAGNPIASGQAGHYREHWSAASHTREGTFPQSSVDNLHANQQSAQYNRRHEYSDQHDMVGHGSYYDQLRQNNFNSGYRSTSGKLVTGAIDMGHVGHSADCTEEHSEQMQYGSRYHRNYKRSANYNGKDDMRFTAQNVDTHPELEQQTTTDLHPSDEKFSQEIQHPKYEDLSQQTVGKLEFSQGRNYPYSGNKPKYNNEVDDLTQQTTGQLEFGQHARNTQQNEDFTQQSTNLDDFAEQFEHDTQKPSLLSIPSISKPYSDFSQQRHVPPTIGSLEFERQNQHHQNAEMPHSQHKEDLTQQSVGVSQMPGFQNFPGPFTNRKPGADSQYPYGAQRSASNKEFDDMARNTGNSHDLLQHSNANIEFGQHSRNPWKPVTDNQDKQTELDFAQENEDLTQQTGMLDHVKQQIGDFDDFAQQTPGKFEFSQQTQYPEQRPKPESDSQHRADLTQQTQDFSQQTLGKLEFGQQAQYPRETRPKTPDTTNQHYEDFSQHSTQQTSDKLELGQQITQNNWKSSNSNQYQDYNQQWQDSTQQTLGKLEFGQQTQNTEDLWKPATGNQYLEDIRQKGEDNMQQVGELNDITQQTSGKLELSQQTQQQNQPWDHFRDVTQEHDDLTQQTTGNLQFGQHQEHPSRYIKPNRHNHNTELTQDNENLPQQTGRLEFGQYEHQSHRPSTIDRNTQLLESHRNANFNQQDDKKVFEDSLQQTQYVRHGRPSDSPVYHNNYEHGSQHVAIGSQSTEEPSGVLPLEIESNNKPEQPWTELKPAEKPKPRPRYSKPVVIQSLQTGNEELTPTDYPPMTKGTPENSKAEDLRADQDPDNDNINTQKQVPVSAFDMERGNGDQVNWLHKSNDATVGLQWHYTYHPSDLTNSEPVQNSYYPNINYNSHSQHRQSMGASDEHAKPTSENKQESSDTTTFSNTDHQFQSQNNEHRQVSYEPIRVHEGVKGRYRPSMSRQVTPTLEPKLEPRILEAYGGGPYDGTRDDNIYSRVTPNPSATLPPLNVEDPWDIREKPREPWGTTITAEIIAEAVKETTEPDIITTPAPSFWGRLGHKITNTFDKARDKARGIFG